MLAGQSSSCLIYLSGSFSCHFARLLSDLVSGAFNFVSGTFSRRASLLLLERPLAVRTRKNTSDLFHRKLLGRVTRLDLSSLFSMIYSLFGMFARFVLHERKAKK